MIENYPGKRSFYKYAAPETALAVLRSRAVRYSSPLKFNDPFDMQSGLSFDFDVDTLYAKVNNRIEELARAIEEPPVDKNDPWGKIVLLVRENYLTHGFPWDQLEPKTAPHFDVYIRELKTTQLKYQENWNTSLPGMRVFCVSEERDNLLMWAHYAKDHTGAVFEFLSLPDEDNPLSVAQPVIYADRPVPFFTETEWIDDILSVRKLNRDGLYKRYVTTKSTHWLYESEWRVCYPVTPTPGTLHEDVTIRPSEFSAVYIGCRAEPDFVNDVLSLTHSAYPHARIYRARKSQIAYELEYTEV
jgi:hypothetical protein